MTMPIDNFHEQHGLPATKGTCDGSVYNEECYQTRYPTKATNTSVDTDVTWIKYDGNALGPTYVDTGILNADGTDRFAKSVEGSTVSGTPIKENQALDSQRLFVKGLGFTIPSGATILAAAIVWRWFNNSTYMLTHASSGYTIDVTKVSINGRLTPTLYGIAVPATTPFGNSNAGLSAPMSSGFGRDKTETGYINDTNWKHEISGDSFKLTPEFINSPETILAFDTHKTAGPGTGNYELSLYEFGLIIKYTFLPPLPPGAGTDAANLIKMSTF